jgi:ABC-2 type transport system ATP-binding protein
VLAIGPPRELGPGGGADRYRVTYRDADGALVELDTEEPTPLLHELTAKALAEGWALRDLSVGRPTLEDVYLELTADA